MTAQERQALVLSHQPLVSAAVQTVMARYGLPETDRQELRAVGSLALVEAAARFDRDHGVTFGSFAQQRVHGSLADHLVRSVGSARENERLQDPDIHPSHDANPEQVLAGKQAAQELLAKLETLPDRERAIIRGRYFEDRSITEIADREAIAKSWASRLHDRALESLRGLTPRQEGPER